MAAPTRKTVSEVYDELRALYERQVASGERAERTLEAYDYRVKARVLPVIGNRPIQKITAADVSAMIDTWRERGYSPATIDETRPPLARLFGFAVRRGYLSENPLDRMNPESGPA